MVKELQSHCDNSVAELKTPVIQAVDPKLASLEARPSAVAVGTPAGAGHATCPSKFLEMEAFANAAAVRLEVLEASMSQIRSATALNPAGLFTKHLTSRDKVNLLVELLNCEYRDGRESAAPQLKKDTATLPARHLATLADDINKQGPAHDPDILLHNYNDEDLNSMFPRAVASEDPDGVPTYCCICCLRTCAKCFPPQPQGPSHDGVCGVRTGEPEYMR